MNMASAASGNDKFSGSEATRMPSATRNSNKSLDRHIRIAKDTMPSVSKSVPQDDRHVGTTTDLTETIETVFPVERYNFWQLASRWLRIASTKLRGPGEVESSELRTMFRLKEPTDRQG